MACQLLSRTTACCAHASRPPAPTRSTAASIASTTPSGEGSASSSMSSGSTSGTPPTRVDTTSRPARWGAIQGGEEASSSRLLFGGGYMLGAAGWNAGTSGRDSGSTRVRPGGWPLPCAELVCVKLTASKAPLCTPTAPSALSATQEQPPSVPGKRVPHLPPPPPPAPCRRPL